METGGKFDGVVTAMQTASTDVTGLMTDILPYALGVFVITWGVRKGIKFFKSASN